MTLINFFGVADLQMIYTLTCSECTKLLACAVLNAMIYCGDGIQLYSNNNNNHHHRLFQTQGP